MKWIVILMAALLIPSVSAYCDVSLSIKYEIEDSKILFSHTLTGKASPFVIEYWVEDSNGNIIKPKRNTTNLHTKSFTPPKNIDTVMIKSRIAALDCDNTNKEGEYAEKSVSLNSGNSLSIRLRVNEGNSNYKSSAAMQKNEKMKGVIPFFIILALALISIVLIWRR